MKIYIDRNIYNYIDDIIELTEVFAIDCVFIHNFDQPIDVKVSCCEIIVIDLDNELKDYKIYTMITKSDIVLTNDMDFALLCSSKGAIVLNKAGIIHDENEIYYKLNEAHNNKKYSKKRYNKKTESDRDYFITMLSYAFTYKLEISNDNKDCNNMIQQNKSNALK